MCVHVETGVEAWELGSFYFLKTSDKALFPKEPFWERLFSSCCSMTGWLKHHPSEGIGIG